MAKDNINSKKGFTIIEVVLVLAIAGLIFLMVFVALPALQRSQRDTARRNDLARVDTSLVQYQTNNQGTNNGSNLPYDSTPYRAYTNFTSAATAINIPGVGEGIEVGGECGNDVKTGNTMSCVFLRDYMNSGTAGTDKPNEFQDPAGVYYGMDIGNGAYTYNGTDMDYIIHVRTGAKCEGESAVADSARHFAVIYRLEGAGTYCIDDQ
ncbi:type II secretion system protein [Candidatus Saccharibacteria bacterium]|nr:type II secretion system protein [Candidatus Saccharibacteria bacterium]